MPITICKTQKYSKKLIGQKKKIIYIMVSYIIINSCAYISSLQKNKTLKKLNYHK